MFLFFCQLNINQLCLLFFEEANLRKICEISVWYRQINTIKLRIRKLETCSLVSER